MDHLTNITVREREGKVEEWSGPNTEGELTKLLLPKKKSEAHCKDK